MPIELDMSPLPRPHEFWERPPLSEEGERNKEALYVSVGRALDCWELVESHCAGVFYQLVESSSEAAYRAYGCIISAPSRREMLANAAEIFFEDKNIPEAYQERFEDLLNHYSSAVARRNEIAHGHTLAVQKGDAFHHFLVAASYNSRKTHEGSWNRRVASGFYGSKYCFVASHIEGFASNFVKLGMWLGDFENYLVMLDQERRRSAAVRDAILENPAE